MKKRKEQKYSTKELEEELIEFMCVKHKRYIELETFHESCVVTLSYCRDKENMIATCAIRM
ncbi:TPA: hypothetical protein ACHJ3G_002654 [Enterococcus faecalis]